MFTIVTDESADHYLDLGVPKVMFKMIYKDQEVRLSTKDVCELIEGGEVLTTSQVSIKAFRDAFENAEEPIICITISDSLSGTFKNAKIAARMSKKRIAVIDSETISVGLGLLVEKAVELKKKGVEFEEAVKELEEYKKRIRIYFTLKNLTYLARSGRISNVFAGLGNFIGINPVMNLYLGKAKVLKIVRGFEKAAYELEKKAKGKKALVGYICAEDLGNKLAEKMATEAIELCPVIACHVGPAVVVGVVE